MPIVGIVDHVVLFKVQYDASAGKIKEMLKQLNALRAINGVLHLKACPILFLWPAHKVLGGSYTHVLHSRHESTAALHSFKLHPAQIYTMDTFVSPILAEGYLAVDWESNVEKHVDQFFEAKRILLCKLKPEVCEEGRAKLVKEIRETSSSKFECWGANFSPVRSNDFNFGYIGFFRKIDELEQLRNNPDHLSGKLQDGPYVETFHVIDCANQTGHEPENSPLAIPPLDYDTAEDDGPNQ